jgi:hypothetical protein
VKNILINEIEDLKIISERSVWAPVDFVEIIDEKAKEYYLEIKNRLRDSIFQTNVLF